VKAVFNPFTESLDFVGSPTVKFRVSCLPDDQVGQAMYVTGDFADGAYPVTCVDIADFAKVPTVGILTLKSSATSGIVTASGVVPRGGLIPGRLYFVGADGFPTATRPSASSPSGVFVQALGKALSSSRLLLNISAHITKVIP
jgi:hypothetical protein